MAGWPALAPLIARAGRPLVIEALRAWAEDFRSSMAEIAGVVVFREGAKGTPGDQGKQLTVGSDHLIYQTARAAYRVSAGSFLSTSLIH